MTRAERHPMTGRPRLLTMGLAAIAASSWQSCSNDSTGPGSSAVASVIVTPTAVTIGPTRSEEHTSELQSRLHLVCRLLLEKKKNILRSHRPMVAHMGGKDWAAKRPTGVFYEVPADDHEYL